MLAGPSVGLRLGHARREFGEGSQGRLAAQRRKLDDRSQMAGLVRRAAEPAERVAHEAGEAPGIETAGRGIGENMQQRGTAEAQERLAAGIVDGDVPAHELGLDAPRQAAVGRHQAGAAARRLQRIAQDERNDGRFLLAVLRLDQLDARKCRRET